MPSPTARLTTTGSLLQDASRYTQGPGSRAVLRALVFSPGMLACFSHRLSQRWRRRHPILAACVRRAAVAVTGAELHPDAAIGSSLRLAHTVGTVIGAGTVIGSEVTIYQGVTLGAVRMGEGRATSEAYPRIGDRVTIYAGAVVLGGITIGDDAVIGANSVVLTDVPAAHVAVGAPARTRARRTAGSGEKGS